MIEKPRIRCSQLGRLLACPGSRVLEALIAPREGDDGVEGTMLHWQTAWKLVDRLGASQPAGGIPTPKGVPIGYRVPSYCAWIVDWCFRHVKETVPITWALEVENELFWEFDNFILTGHEDVCATSPNGTEGIDTDWKTGKIPVTAAELNKQVMGYMALRALNYTDLNRLSFTVAQPWNDEDDGFERRSKLELEGNALKNNFEVLESDINDALNDADLLNTGMIQCKYCVGPGCPAIREHTRIMKMRLTPELLANVRREVDSGILIDLVADGRALKKPLEDAEHMLKDRLKGSPVLTSQSGIEARLKTSGAGYKVVDPVGMLKELDDTFTTEQLGPLLSYPSGRIKDGLAKTLEINKSGNAEMTAETVFAAKFAPFIEAKEKTSLLLT